VVVGHLLKVVALLHSLYLSCPCQRIYRLMDEVCTHEHI
jgi:hypothetical protein